MTTLVAIVILCSCLLVSGARVPVYVGVLLELSDHWWSDYTKLFPVLLNHALEDIYNTTDILRDYEIKLVVKDTKGKSGMSGKLLNELLSEGPPKPVVIGPGLSEEILVTGQIVPFYNVVQLSYAATTASTADKVLYPTTFSINPLPHQLNRVRIKMMQYFGWKRIGTIAFLTEFTKSQMDSLVDSNDPSSSFNVVTSALISDKDLKNNVKDAIQRLKQFDVRIIHGSFTRGYAPYVFCEAYRQGLYGRHYVWILSGPNLYSSWLDIANTTEVGCSIEELKLGSNGYFTLDYDKAGDSASMTIAGKTVAETEAEILELAKQSPYKLSTSSAHLYDTAWSLALGLNHSLKYLAAKGLSLQDFNYSKQYLDAIMAGLHETTFSGVSGPVSFDKNGFRLGVSSIYQHFNGNQTRVATYDYERDEFLSFINPWPGGPPPDRFSYAENQAPVSDLAFSLITILAGCGILLVGIFFIFNLKFRNQRSIKMSSPLMNSIILLGCFLLYFEVLLSAAFYRNFLKADICMIRTWLLAFGFTTLFGALFAKTYRVYIIFRDVRHNTKIIRDYQLISMVAVMLLVDCVILVPWSIKYPLKITNISKAVKTEFVVYTTYYPQCQSDSEDYWFASLYIYKGLLLAFGVFLSWETRNVRVAELNDSKLIAACVYNVVIMCLFGVIVSHALPLDQITLGFSMETGIVLFCTTVCLCILFIPKIQDRNKVHGKFVLSPSVINRIETTDSNRVQEISDSQSNVISLTSENIKIIADLKAENNTLRMQVAKEHIAMAKLRKSLLAMTGDLHLYKSGDEYVIFRKSNNSVIIEDVECT